MNTPKPSARMGRPPRFPEEGARIGHSLRLKPSTDKALREAAERNNRSLAEEMEYRINTSFEIDAKPNALDLGFNIGDFERVCLEKELLEIERDLTFARTRVFICIEKLSTIGAKRRYLTERRSSYHILKSIQKVKRVGSLSVIDDEEIERMEADLDALRKEEEVTKIEYDLAVEDWKTFKDRRLTHCSKMNQKGITPDIANPKKYLVGRFVSKLSIEQEEAEG